jgi:lysophospholipid acyltransferase (LPLAT)-like uncharacterized protein
VRSLLLGLGCLWLRTLRVRWPSGTDLPDRAVILLWHEHLPACIRAFSGKGIDVLISRSADGDWAALACERFGYRVHRGSSSRGSTGGMRALVRAMDNGIGLAGMALDGPRGPRRIPKEGSLWLARYAGVPVVPVFVEARNSFRLKSWDRCLVPLPFSEIRVNIGAPLRAEHLGEIAEAMADLENGIPRKRPGPVLRPL